MDGGVHPSLDSTNVYGVTVNMGIRLLPGPEAEFRVHWKTEAVKNKTQKKLGVVAHTSDPSSLEGGGRRNGSSKSSSAI